MQSKMAQDATKIPHEDPKMAPRSFKMASDGPKMPKDGRRGFQDGSTSGRRDAFSSLLLETHCFQTHAKTSSKLYSSGRTCALCCL